MYKICPKCKKQYYELANYCRKCGIALEKDRNRCSENKTTLCGNRNYEDDDVYCEYCGSLTTYALERQVK